MTKETDLQMIENNGRRIAQDWLGQMLEGSENVDDLNVKIHTLQCAAVHIIATNIYNRVSSMNESEMSVLMDVKEHIYDEYNLIKKHEKELEVTKIKESKNE